MKNSLIALVIASALVTMYSCKENKKQEEQTSQTTTQETTETKPAGASSSEPKTFTVTATPDSVSLGKN